MKSKNKGYEPVDGPWRQASGEMFHVACCGCGLVHDVTLTTMKSGKIKVKYYQNKYLTRKNRGKL